MGKVSQHIKASAEGPFLDTDHAGMVWNMYLQCDTHCGSSQNIQGSVQNLHLSVFARHAKQN